MTVQASFKVFYAIQSLADYLHYDDADGIQEPLQLVRSWLDLVRADVARKEKETHRQEIAHQIIEEKWGCRYKDCDGLLEVSYDFCSECGRERGKEPE